MVQKETNVFHLFRTEHRTESRRDITGGLHRRDQEAKGATGHPRDRERRPQHEAQSATVGGGCGSADGERWPV